MRNDEEHGLDLVPAPETDRPATARTRSRGVLAVVLTLLTAATCWAVAVLASAWLVPPYLLLMALILFAPTARPRDGSDSSASTSANSLDPACRTEGRADASMTSDSSPESASADPAVAGNTDPSTTPAPAKGKRGRGKSRKIKPAPVEASWVQVGPGKFVRVEAPETAAQAGPHEAVGVPAMVPTSTPQTLWVEVEGQIAPNLAHNPAFVDEVSDLATDADGEPAEAVDSSFDPVDARDDAPAGVALPEPPSAIIGEDDALTGWENERNNVPAADGIAPQAEDVFPDAPETEWAEPLPEEEPGRDRDAAIDPEWEDDDRTLADHFLPSRLEPTEDHSFETTATSDPDENDPEYEYQDEAETPVLVSELAAEVFEPTSDELTEETEAWDETWSDDSEAILDTELPSLAMPDDVADELEPSSEADFASVDDDGFDPSAADFAGDLPAPGAVPDAWAGSPGWTSRLVPRSRTRDGANRPAIGNATPSRRHDRSRRPAPRRPLDARPPSRRGLGRARQITRTAPPRSPPHHRRSRGE